MLTNRITCCTHHTICTHHIICTHHTICKFCLHHSISTHHTICTHHIILPNHNICTHHIIGKFCLHHSICTHHIILANHIICTHHIILDTPYHLYTPYHLACPGAAGRGRAAPARACGSIWRVFCPGMKPWSWHSVDWSIDPQQSQNLSITVRFTRNKKLLGFLWGSQDFQGSCAIV